MRTHDRKSFIREEVLYQERLGTDRLDKEQLSRLIKTDKETDEDDRLKGYASFRLLRHDLAFKFNYINPGMDGQEQTDFVISQYDDDEKKQCSLDLVFAVAYLAFLDPSKAKEMELNVEYIYTQRNLDLLN